jgi:hypothetical protein
MKYGSISSFFERKRFRDLAQKKTSITIKIKIMIALMEMGLMLAAGTVFSTWMAKHDNLEVR